LLNNWKIKIHKLFLGRPPKPVFTNPYAPPLDKNGKVKPAAKPRITLSFPFIEECVKVIKEDKVAIQSRLTWNERILATPVTTPRGTEELKEELLKWLKTETKTNTTLLSSELENWLDAELKKDTEITNAIEEWTYDEDVKELEEIVKPIKFTNDEIRTRLLFKWKKKIKYWLCHQWHFWKGCNGCKDSSPCERFRKQKMFSGS
jgi:hypothetical protein